MSKSDKVVVGYFGVNPPADVLCDGEACVIAGKRTDLNRYAARLSGQNPAQIMKTRFGEILMGLIQGGSYAFDKKAYAVFYPLAISSGLPLKHGLDYFQDSDDPFILVKQG